jgi:hypothetical protein
MAFEIFISSHGEFGVVAPELPYSVGTSLPGVLHRGGAAELNETWDAQGKPPYQLGNTDDEMPLWLDDGRLKKCAEQYLTRHLEAMVKKRTQATAKWNSMIGRTSIVDGVKIATGDQVHRLFSEAGERSAAVEDGKFTFLCLENDTVYLWTESKHVVSYGLGRSHRRRYWLEPAGAE